MATILRASALGSIRLMCLAVDPAATRFKAGIAAALSSACDVVRVSTQLEVVRSHVFRLWSQETEYATVWSEGWKRTSDAGPVWPESVLRGPRCSGADDLEVFESFRRLLLDRGSRLLFASGRDEAVVAQMPTVWSAEAESIRWLLA